MSMMSTTAMSRLLAELAGLVEQRVVDVGQVAHARHVMARSISRRWSTS
jgi:hypothetical protein